MLRREFLVGAAAAAGASAFWDVGASFKKHGQLFVPDYRDDLGDEPDILMSSLYQHIDLGIHVGDETMNLKPGQTWNGRLITMVDRQVGVIHVRPKGGPETRWETP